MSTHNSSSVRDEPFRRGHVVWVEWAEHNEARPFLILSGDSQPTHADEYLGVPLSTASQSDSVRVQSEDWETGGPDQPSFALIWRLQSIPHQAIVQGIGALRDEVVEEVAQSAKAALETSE
jgi:mRNA-degrading endonuclease toxin of MazEF toxin-antitoxin module